MRSSLNSAWAGAGGGVVPCRLLTVRRGRDGHSLCATMARHPKSEDFLSLRLGATMTPTNFARLARTLFDRFCMFRLPLILSETGL